MTEFAVKDSGKREEFTSGMVRDTEDNKADFTTVFNGPMLDRWAEHLTKGAKKYPDVEPGVPNWTLASGMAELIRFRKSAARHFRQWLRGDTDEDHAAAVFFNINGAEYVRAKLAALAEAERDRVVFEPAPVSLPVTLTPAKPRRRVRLGRKHTICAEKGWDYCDQCYEDVP